MKYSLYLMFPLLFVRIKKADIKIHLHKKSLSSVGMVQLCWQRLVHISISRTIQMALKEQFYRYHFIAYPHLIKTHFVGATVFTNHKYPLKSEQCTETRDMLVHLNGYHNRMFRLMLFALLRLRSTPKLQMRIDFFTLKHKSLKFFCCCCFEQINCWPYL